MLECAIVLKAPESSSIISSMSSSRISQTPCNPSDGITCSTIWERAFPLVLASCRPEGAHQCKESLQNTLHARTVALKDLSRSYGHLPSPYKCIAKLAASHCREFANEEFEFVPFEPTIFVIDSVQFTGDGEVVCYRTHSKQRSRGSQNNHQKCCWILEINTIS